MKRIFNLLKAGALLILLTFASLATCAIAANHRKVVIRYHLKKQDDDIVFGALPVKKEAIFDANEKITYKVDLKNNGDAQSGTLGYIMMNMQNKVLAQNAIAINLGKKADKNYMLDLPSQSSGFYKVSITINTPNYDDTIRRVFGVNPKEIKSKTEKPADFDAFWNDIKSQLAQVEPNFKVTLMPDLEKQNTSVYLVEMQSLDNITVRGWLTFPKNRNKKERFSVWLALPGYGGDMKPIYGSSEMAIFSLNVRGLGNSRDVIKPTRNDYLTYRIDDKNKYIYKGAIMDCIRAVDFLASRQDIDASSIIVTGGSMGGYLSLVTSSLDQRIKLCSANNPVFCDYRELLGNKDWPMSDFKRYADQHKKPLGKIMDVLDYYDLKNFVTNLKCKMLLGIGLLDNLAPAPNEFAMYNNIPATTKKKMFVYPDLAHEVPKKHGAYQTMWMVDELGLY